VLGALAIAALLPLVETDVFRLRVLTVGCLAAVLTVGVTISLGYAGLFNMSQGTFYGIGAYTTAILVIKAHVAYELALLASVVFAGACGVLLGVTALRVRGDLWALVSMAFTVAMAVVFANWKPVTNGRDGYASPPQSIAGLRIDTPVEFYYAAFAALCVSLLVAGRLRSTYLGRAMIAVRYDESAASIMGVAPARAKLLAIGVSAALAGLAGSLLLVTTLYITPTSFDFLPSFNFTLYAIVGGVTSAAGGAVAAVVLTYATEAFRSLTEYRLMIDGAVLVLAIFLRAGVLGGALRMLRRESGGAPLLRRH
jgi:branched-chain amino acid transport system permease protein